MSYDVDVNVEYSLTVKNETLPIKPKTNSFGKSGFQCDLCGKAGYSTKKYIKKHLALCLQRSVCGECGKRCRNDAALRKHLVTHNSPLQCDRCDFVTKSLESMKKHIPMHGGHFCPHCEQSYRHKKSLSSHIRKFHSDIVNAGPFKCLDCLMEFSNKDECRQHVRNNHFLPTNCPYCEKICNNDNYLRTHLLEKHDMKLRIKCNECDKTFSTKYNLREHRLSHFPNAIQKEKYRHICDICGDGFQSIPAVQRHLLLHNDPNYVGKIKQRSLSKFKCPLCVNETFKQCSVLRQHLKKIHEDEGAQIWDQLALKICQQCNLIFDTEDKQQSHRLEHYDVQCSVCRQYMTSKEALKNHMTTHSNKDRPHKCDMCGSSYVSVGHLAQHVRRAHLKVRNHKCQLCPKDFIESYELVKHIRIVHENLRKHKCNVCEKTFKNSTELKIHSQKHTGVYKYRCDSCNLNFDKSTRYARHMQVKHPQDKPIVTGDDTKIEEFDSNIII